MKKTLLFLSMMIVIQSACALDETPSENNNLQDARKLVKTFSKTLKHTLKKAIKEGGMANAIESCHLKAPDIASDLSAKSHWNVRRTSLKVRDLEDAPDKWELSVLKRFEEQNKKDVDDELMEFSEITTDKNGKKLFRYMKAIPTRKVCLRCHGEKIKSDVQKQLDSLFPFDQATGFTEDDLRGAFSLSKQLSK